MKKKNSKPNLKKQRHQNLATRLEYRCGCCPEKKK